MEYIEREAALKVLCDACGNAACPKGLIPRCSYYEKMQSIPAADVRPVVRGKWISHDFVSMEKGRYTGSVECSVCHRFLPMKERFCPNCGAKMEER